MDNTLYESKIGTTCLVKAVPDSKLLSSIGVFAGVELRVDHQYQFGGPVAVSLATKKIAIGKDVATKILVEEVAF